MIEEQEGKDGDDDNEARDSEAVGSTGDPKYGEEEEEGEEKPWETLTGAKVKAKFKLFQERHWAATEIFYANLAAATERLAATRTPEKGYVSQRRSGTSFHREPYLTC